MFYFQIYHKEIPVQCYVGTQYYFLFLGNGKQAMILYLEEPDKVTQPKPD
jgi:hypothetical protein